MSKTILFLSCIIFLFACQGTNQTSEVAQNNPETQRLNAFLDKAFDEKVDRDPKWQSYLGIKKDYGKWTDISDAAADREFKITKQLLDTLHMRFNVETLDEQGKLSYRLFEYEAQRQIEGHKYRHYNYPVNQMDGMHSDIPAFLINIHSITSVDDAQAYIDRLNGIGPLFDQLLVQLKIREDRGIIPPKFVFPMVMDDCKNLLKGRPFDNSKSKSTLLEDFTNKVMPIQNLSTTAKEALISDAEKALVTSVKPAYEKLMAYWAALEPKAKEDAGAWKFPDGREFYSVALKQITTTNLSAEEIHKIGLKEVERIHGEMRKIMEKVNFKGDLKAFFAYMKESKQFYYPNDDKGRREYMGKAVAIIENMKHNLDKLFVTKPKAEMVVKAVEAFREKSAGGAFYEDPAIDGSRPGRYYINLYNMADQPIYQMEALAYHEGIPGHHMQIAIAQELQGIPKFRRHGGNVAYVEGWALYSEVLPKELGMYSDPYSDFGRLAMELFRAARLVVDTGIHFAKWSREKAIVYMNENTPNSDNDNRKEIERYIVWPAQATGYKIGMLKILELREKAKQELKDKFDIREFHDVVLTSGPVPLEILEQNVDAWVAKKEG